MVYRLQFTEATKDRFAHLYTAFVQGGGNVQPGSKNVEILRREIGILDTLCDVSVVPAGAPPEGVRELLPGDHCVTLTQDQYALVKKYLEAYASVVATVAVRKAVALIDWFDSLRPEDPAAPARLPAAPPQEPAAS